LHILALQTFVRGKNTGYIRNIAEHQMANIRNEFQVGLFVLTGLVLFLGSLFAIGSERQIFGVKEQFTTYFTDIKGLNSGAPIRLGGITIGKVGHIEFVPRVSKKNIKVELKIDQSFTSHLKVDTTASLGTQGLLGDKFIHIGLGVEPENLGIGSEIESIETPDISEMTDKATELVAKVTSTVDNINSVFVDIKDKGVVSLLDSLDSLKTFLSNIENGDGIFASLINSKDMSKDLKDITKNIRQVSDDLINGQGLLPKLMRDKSGGDILTTLNETARQLRTVSEAIARLVPAGGDASALDSLSKVARNLEEISTAISQGQGTLGALLMDSSLYDNAVEITDDAKRNIILRQAIRQTLK
jgi:phospholipid/cholesterol/gamma-HCH transport system substrate-binding protein